MLENQEHWVAGEEATFCNTENEYKITLWGKNECKYQQNMSSLKTDQELLPNPGWVLTSVKTEVS